MGYKQVIVVRKDLKMTKGKMAVQVAHASIGTYKLTLKKEPETAKKWMDQGMKKVTVYAENQKELFMLKEQVKKKIPLFVV